MQYMLLIDSGGEVRDRFDNLSPVERTSVTEEHPPIARAPGLVRADQPHPADTATTGRGEGGRAPAVPAGGDEEDSLLVLADALSPASRDGYLGVLADQGLPVVALLKRLIGAQRHGRISGASGPPAEHLERTVRAPEPATRDAPAPARSGTVEPLTARELEVLGLIATGKSNRHIADELVVSLDTVKKHASHIFAKLGAANRTEAAGNARKLGLLSTSNATSERSGCPHRGCPFVGTGGNLIARRTDMKYMLLIHSGDTVRERVDDLSEAERNQILEEYRALGDVPGVLAGDQLHPADTATTVRVEGGRTLMTDGPFIEMKEALGGYILYEADDLDAALELAARIPAARMGGAIEVRPIVER